MASITHPNPATQARERDPLLHDLRRGFLGLLHPSQCAQFANALISAFRAGATDEADALCRVERLYLGRLNAGERVRDQLAQQQARAVLDALVAHPDEARAFASWCRAWNQLPAPERKRRKGELTEQPPTPRQVAYTRLLGHSGPVTSKADATQIIDSLKAGKVA